VAYLRELTKTCANRFCGKRATVELVDFRNESRGCFCKKHGDQQLKSRNEWEKKEFNTR
jgi:hypothetical protein